MGGMGMRGETRMAAVQAPVIPIVGELIRSNPGTISLGQGVVHWGPPAEALGALRGFGREVEDHKYKLVQGIPPLIDAIEAKLYGQNGIRVQPASRVVVTAGANMGFMNAVLAITSPGDEIILLSPYYFNHEMAIVMADCRAVVVETDDAYMPRLDALRDAITPRTRAIVTISPNNPTGAVYGEETLRAINALCAARGIYHISDEAYEDFVYAGAEHFSPGSIAGAAGHTISLYSLSKAYGFASWRIGYMVIPEELFESVRKVQDTILICPPVVSQVAAAGALAAGPGYAAGYVKRLAKVRREVLDALGQIQHLITTPASMGAFYFLPRVHTEMPSMELVERLVREYKVAVMPGSAFGVGGCALRVAYGALGEGTVVEGVGRLVAGLRGVVGGGQ